MQAYMGGIAPTFLADSKKSSCLAIYLAGCDFNCTHCSTKELIDFKEDYLTTILDIKKDITSHSINVDAVFFTGAEPCLQRQAVLALARHSKAANLRIGLKTHGTKPETLKSLLNEELIDFVEFNIMSDFKNSDFDNITRSANFFNPTSTIIQSIYDSLNLLKKNPENFLLKV